MPKILVTGGAGYIGSHTAKELARRGYTPVVYDNLDRGNASAVRWGPLVRGDLADTDHLVATLRGFDIEAVLHFAAYAYVGESMKQPGRYFRNNVTGTLSLLESMRKAGVLRIVVSSTCATYGSPAVLPITEDAPQQPVNVYGETKVMMERIVRWYSEIYGIRYVILRYFNAAGADPDGELGEVHDPETHLIPLVIRAALGQGLPVNIFGNDYNTPDGTCVRDYIHVCDLADAHIRALDYLGGENHPAVFNLGSGIGHSVLEVIEMVAKQANRVVPHRIAPRRPGDPPVLIAAADRARRILGWRPTFSGLESIVSTAWEWHKYKIASVH